MAEEILTLASLGKGAVLELFDRELQRVLENISDINTNPRTKREIQIKVIFEPEDKDREIAYATVEFTTKLAGVNPTKPQTLYIGKKDGKLVAVAENLRTPTLFDNEKPTITPLRSIPGFAPAAHDGGDPA
jgi:hypothetical protein